MMPVGRFCRANSSVKLLTWAFKPRNNANATAKRTILSQYSFQCFCSSSRVLNLVRCVYGNYVVPSGENVKKIAHRSTPSTTVCPDASLQAHADQYLQAKSTSSVKKMVKATKVPPAAARVVYILVHSPATSLDNKKEWLPSLEQNRGRQTTPD